MSLLDALLKEGAAETSGKEVFIAIRNDGFAGSGTMDDPFDGSTDQKLDNLLNGASITGGMTIRFGPGVFETKGFGTTRPFGWQVKDSQLSCSFQKRTNACEQKRTRDFRVDW